MKKNRLLFQGLYVCVGGGGEEMLTAVGSVVFKVGSPGDSLACVGFWDANLGTTLHREQEIQQDPEEKNKGRARQDWVVTLPKAVRLLLRLELMELSTSTAGVLPRWVLSRLSTREKSGWGGKGRERGGIIYTPGHPQETWGTKQHQGHQQADLRLDSQGDDGVGGVGEVELGNRKQLLEGADLPSPVKGMVE